MAINTDIPLTNRETQVYKKFKSLSVNEQPKAQGDGVLRISPFDDYFIFTIYDEIDGENTPVDLSNVGTIFMVFVGENDEIRIPNYTQVQDVDLSSGQVLFRVSKDESKKILALDNKNFFISTVMIDPDGTSDESVLYTGTFLSFSDAAKKSLTTQLEDLRVEYSKEVAALQLKIEELNKQIKEKDQLISEQAVAVDALKVSNQNLSDEIAVITSEMSSTKVSNLLNQAALAQKLENASRLKRQQVQANKEKAKTAQTNAQKTAYYKQASKNLQKYSTGSNAITSGNSGISGVSGNNGIL